MSAALKVARAGLFDTLQDLGRIGFMALGMPTAGAMDRVALRLANALCGNPAGTAGIEFGVMGPDLLVEADSVRVALVGPLSPALIEAPDAPPKPLESDRTHLLKRGQILKVGMVEGSSTPTSPSPAALRCRPSWAACRPMRGPASAASKAASSPRVDALPLAREQAPPGDESKLGQPFDYGSGPIRIVWGPQDDHFSDARPPHLHRVRLPRFQGGRSHGHPLRGADEHAVAVDKGGATSSPTASVPAPSRCRAPACRSCC